MLSFFLVACKKPTVDSDTTKVEEQIKIRVVNGVKFSEDNVSIRVKESPIELDRYYTSIDTIDKPVAVSYNLCALVDKDDSLRVSWQLAGKAIPDYRQEKVWNEVEKKWFNCGYGTCTHNRESARLTLRATFNFLKNNKIVTRDIPIEILSKDYYYDLYRVNFGMSKAQVKTNETGRVSTALDMWQDPSLTTAKINISLSLGVPESFTYYEFEDNKLKRVSDVLLEPKDFSSIQALAKTYKIPVNPLLKVDRYGTVIGLNQEQVWDNGKIKFTLSFRDFQLNNSEKKKLFAITYEKL